jgi:hypothetical protein
VKTTSSLDERSIFSMARFAVAMQMPNISLLETRG